MDLERWLDRRNGVVRTGDLVKAGIGEPEIKAMVRRGEWCRIFRGVIATERARGSESHIRCRAALVLAGRGAYLTCLGAARLRGLPVAPDVAIHVTVPKKRSICAQPGFMAHRDALALPPSWYAGLPTVSVEAALVGAFGCLDSLAARRALVIESVRDGLVSAARVAAATPARSRRRSELLDLLEVCACSQSEAEIAMLERVIRAAGLPEPRRQHRVTVAARNYRLDIAYPEVGLAIEVDGKEWHFNATRRTADITRDAQLAAAGWLTLRFTYEQIDTAADWVAGCIAAALASRAKIT